MAYGERQKYCPFVTKPCPGEACALWSGTGKYAKCVFHEIAGQGFKLYKIQQLLERGGVPAGGGFVDELPRKQAAQTGTNYPDSDDDFDGGPF